MPTHNRDASVDSIYDASLQSVIRCTSMYQFFFYFISLLKSLFHTKITLQSCYYRPNRWPHPSKLHGYDRMYTHFTTKLDFGMNRYSIYHQENCYEVVAIKQMLGMLTC